MRDVFCEARCVRWMETKRLSGRCSCVYLAVMKFVATEVEGQYRVLTPFRRPFHAGSMLRGVLGRSLRAAACANRAGACAGDCEHPRSCAYTRLFDPLVPEPAPHRFLQGQTRAPQPMIPLFPAPGHKDLRAGDVFSLGLRVLGPLRDGELDTIFATLEGMSQFDFGDEGGRVAFAGASLRGRRESPIEVGDVPLHVERVIVEFETPVWMEHGNRLVERVEFRKFFRDMYRRLTVLSALYGELEARDNEEFSRLDALAAGIAVMEQNVRTLQWKRHSLAREREHRLQGIVGRVEFAGAGLEAFVPILRLAERTHLGKATSHGLGRMRVEVR